MVVDTNQNSQKRGQTVSRAGRSRSNTAHSYKERYAVQDDPIPEYEQEPLPVRPSIRSAGRVPSSSHLAPTGAYHEAPVQTSPSRPHLVRSHTIQGPTIRRDVSPSAIRRDVTPQGRKPSFANDASMVRNQLRPSSRIQTDVFSDPSDASTANSTSPDRSPGARSISPATSHGSVLSRQASFQNLQGTTGSARKGPPPPPPSRSKKPAPPPPMKRADMRV